MWLFHKTGFLSIVQDKSNSNRLLVRGRVKTDLETFAAIVAETNRYKHHPKVKTTEVADYRFRFTASREAIAKTVTKMVLSIDYHNFKNAAHATPERNMAMLRVWNAMADLQPPQVFPAHQVIREYGWNTWDREPLFPYTQTHPSDHPTDNDTILGRAFPFENPDDLPESLAQVKDREFDEANLPDGFSIDMGKDSPPRRHKKKKQKAD